MAAERDTGVASDTEHAEKPVREKLKKASISREKMDGHEGEPDVAEHMGENGGPTDKIETRGRLHKKRSFEEVESEQAQESTAAPVKEHTRKRSRDSTAEEHELHNGQRKSGERARDGDVEAPAASEGQTEVPSSDRPGTPERQSDKREEAKVEPMTSPKIKRSRLQSDTTTAQDGTAAKDLPPLEAVQEDVPGSTKEQAKETPESTTELKPASKLPPSSGFANTSTSSPFAALASAKFPSSDSAQTSSSAFAASGFSALSSSASSPFGTIGKSTGGFGAGGGFATGSKSPPVLAQEKQAAQAENEKPKAVTTSAFGGALGQQSAFAAAGSASGGSGFGSGASGFGGKLGPSTGFGGTGFGTLGGGSGLSSFASGKPTTTLPGSSKSPKAFGAPLEDDEDGEEEGEEDESGFKSPLSQDSDKQDERFYKQQLETGEEDESTEYSCSTRLYVFTDVADGKKKEWKERGLGTIRLNVKRSGSGLAGLDDDQENGKIEGPLARLLMRANGSHRVILNTSVTKKITYGGTPKGEPPTGGELFFMGNVDGKPGLEPMRLKAKPQFVKELYDKIVELQEAM